MLLLPQQAGGILLVQTFDGGTTRPVCSDCRLMPTIETVVLKRLLLEQIAEQGDGQ